jgi:RNA recognition motif-containing protein
MTSNNPLNKRLFIGGVPYKFREGQLLTLFVEYGKVVDVRIIYNKWGRSRGLAYIEFEDINDALNAQKNLHNYQLDPERHLIVDFAKPDPFLTPEGKAKHLEAEQKKQLRHPRKPSLATFKPSSSDHSRQSVFDSRHYHSSVGAKFAQKTRKKRSK